MDYYIPRCKARDAVLKACRILGQNVLEHDLIVGDTKTINRVLSSRNFKEIVEIMHERQVEVYGKHKKLSLPGNRDLYLRFMGENHPNFKLI